MAAGRTSFEDNMAAGFLFASGLAGLALGGRFLIHFTVRLSEIFQLRPVVLSIVILGMGTSAPEWVVTVLSGFKGLSHIAVGNVTGSNIANILLILGVSGIFWPIQEEKGIKTFSLPALLFFLVCMFVLCGDGRLRQWEGLLLLTLFAGYLLILLKKSGRNPPKEPPQKRHTLQTEQNTIRGGKAAGLEGKPHSDFAAEKKGQTDPKNTKSLWAAFGGLVLGFTLLFSGSEMAVAGAVDMGRAFGLSERVVGLFIVSIGTSLPELAAALAAAFKKKEEMILGNIVGSNIFNTLFVLGSAAVVSPLESPKSFFPDYALMFGAALTLWILLLSFGKAPRGFAVLFLGIYGAYLSFNLF